MNFNADSEEPLRSALPAGDYPCVITESPLKPTKAMTGHYLELKLQVIDGPGKGQLLWARLNIDNPNPQAVKITRSELATICRAVGVLQPKNSAELHNIPLMVKVSVREYEATSRTNARAMRRSSAHRHTRRP